MAYTEAQARAIIADMLRQGEAEAGELLEMRRSPLSDLAAILADAVSSVPTADALRALTADAPLLPLSEYRLPRDASPTYRSVLTAALASLSSLDRASLAGALVAHLTARGTAPAADTLLACHRLPGRCAYLRNPLSDEAFDRFSPELDAPTSLFVGDMEEACEAVTLGEADYCILPLTASDGRRADSVLAMAHAHRLTIASVCGFLDGEDAPVRFALFGLVPRGGLAGEASLSLSFAELAESALAALIGAAACFGTAVTRVYLDGHAELTLHGGDMTAYLVYLCLFSPDFRVDGYYTEQ